MKLVDVLVVEFFFWVIDSPSDKLQSICVLFLDLKAMAINLVFVRHTMSSSCEAHNAF